MSIGHNAVGTVVLEATLGTVAVVSVVGTILLAVLNRAIPPVIVGIDGAVLAAFVGIRGASVGANIQQQTSRTSDMRTSMSVEGLRQDLHNGLGDEVAQRTAPLVAKQVLDTVGQRFTIREGEQ